MRRTAISILLLIIAITTKSQVAFIINSIPDYTPDGDPVYLAGDFNGWDPGNPDYLLSMNTSGKLEIILPQEPEGTLIQFKFTRGDWSTVEKGAQGEEIANRQFTFGNGDTIYIDILNWADNSGGGNSTAAENVSIVDGNFYMPQFNRERKVWIYLPPDYNDTGESYPVLYMHDGQNLFDQFTSFLGEWEVDETLNELFDEGYSVPIVVGINNGSEHRINEYTPWVNSTYGGGDGELYIDFLIETLKPYIDENYRTLPDRENTGIMGSSLGGLISFYGAIKNQDIFGKSGIFSPSYWFSDSVWSFTVESGKQNQMKMYQLIGSLEGDAVNHMWEMDSLLTELGFGGDELFSIEITNGEHNEELWRDSFRDAYLWLFESYANAINEIEINNPLIISPNPVSNQLVFDIVDVKVYDSLKVYDIHGKIIMFKNNATENVIDVTSIEPGTYVLQISYGKKDFSAKFVKK